MLQGEVLGHVALVAQAQDLAQPVGPDLERAVPIVGPSGRLGEARVVVGHERREHGVGGLAVANTRQAQRLHEAVLQGAVRALDAALRLARVGAQDLDVEFGQGAAELGHPVRVLVGSGHAEHRVLVGVEGDWAAMGFQVALERLEVGERRLRGHEARLQDRARGVVDEDQQRAGRRAVLEPAMLRAVDLDELAEPLASKTGLMEAAPLGSREPQLGLDHPLPKRLPGHLQPVPLGERFGRERGTEVGVALADQDQRVVPPRGVDAVVGRPTARPVPDRGGALGPVPRQEPEQLTPAQTQQAASRIDAQAARRPPGPAPRSAAARARSSPPIPCPSSTPRPKERGSDASAWQAGVSLALRLQPHARRGQFMMYDGTSCC